jgi:guanine deaminase
MALITGLTLQDRHTHPDLELNREGAEQGSLALLQRWHGKERLGYCVTSRFSPACTDDQLALCGELLQAHPDCWFQTHINESLSEIEWVRQLFPNSRDYLDTYEKHGLLGPRSLFAHSIHTSEDELRRMGESQSVVVHCPSSNSFLGSGAFSWQAHQEHEVRIGVGTDVGAGVTFSMWREMGHAYLVQMQRTTRHPLPGAAMLKAMTLDGARALSLDEEIGNFEVGKWADAVHVKASNPALHPNPSTTEELEQWLFTQAMLGDPATVRQTFVAGESVFCGKSQG